jgi:hypothetical protein
MIPTHPLDLSATKTKTKKKQKKQNKTPTTSNKTENILCHITKINLVPAD